MCMDRLSVCREFSGVQNFCLSAKVLNRLEETAIWFLLDHDLYSTSSSVYSGLALRLHLQFCILLY